MESCSNVLSYAKIRASYGANGNVSGVLDANGNVVTGLDYYTVQGSYGIMKDKDGKIVPNYNGKFILCMSIIIGEVQDIFVIQKTNIETCLECVRFFPSHGGIRQIVYHQRNFAIIVGY